MSNEYKDWLEDRACEVMEETGLVSRIIYYTKWYDGFLFIGMSTNTHEKVAYFVWLDDIDGWSYRQIYV